MTSKLEDLVSDHRKTSAAEALREASEFLERRASMEESMRPRRTLGALPAASDPKLEGMRWAAALILDFAADRFMDVRDLT